MGRLTLLVFLAGFIFSNIGCVNKPCRGVVLKKPLLSKEDVFKKDLDDGQRANTVFVFKYDGSLQCKMGKPLSPKEMGEQLNGIKIYSSENKSDGLMHIAACGSPTGRANVYEIDNKDLSSAKKRGFELWTF